MPQINMMDRVTVDAADMRETADGYLVATPRVARTGIQLYRGSEVGMPQMDVVRVYRPEAEVFSKDSMHTFAFKPITNDHPPEPVTADNWRKYSVGNSGGEIARDGEFMRVPMVVMDKATISEIKDGKKELSVGYSTELKWGAGTAPDGAVYDATQTTIRVNHIAVVKEARGGTKLSVGDKSETPEAKPQPLDSASAQGGRRMSDEKKTTIAVDGISLEMSDMAAAIVGKTVKSLSDSLAAAQAQVATLTAANEETKKAAEAAIAKASTDHKTATEAKDAEIATLKKKVEDAATTPAKLDQLVKDRAEVFGKAKSVLGDKLVVDGKNEAEVRRQVVDAKLGDLAKGWTDDQVRVSFDTITSGIKVDAAPPASGVTDTARAFATPAANVQDRAKLYAEADKRLSNAWKDPKVA